MGRLRTKPERLRRATKLNTVCNVDLAKQNAFLGNTHRAFWRDHDRAFAAKEASSGFRRTVLGGSSFLPETVSQQCERVERDAQLGLYGEPDYWEGVVEKAKGRRVGGDERRDLVLIWTWH